MKILKFLLSINLILATTEISFAQSKKIEIGLKAGLNYSNLTAKSEWVTSFNWLIGFQFGGYATIRSNKFAFQPEIVFSRQGQNFNFYSRNNLTTELNYLNIPLVLKYYLIKNLNLQIGPQLGLLTSASGYVYNTSSRAVTKQSVDALIESTDFSLITGVGWELPFGFNLTARYNIGFSDISKYSGSAIPSGTIPYNGTTPIGTERTKNKVIQFSIGYKIN
jgi:hypothetical protein